MMKKRDLAKAQHADEPHGYKIKKKQYLKSTAHINKPDDSGKHLSYISTKIQLNQIRGFVRKYSSDNSLSGKTAHLNKPDDSGKQLYQYQNTA